MAIGNYSHAKLLSLIKKQSQFTQGDAGDITGVTAGNGLSGGGSSGDVSLEIDITGSADGTNITVSGSDFVLIADASDNNAVKRVYVSQLTASNEEPAGENTQIQFNSNGAFGASSNFTFDGSKLSITGSTVANGYISSSHIIPLSDGTYDLGEVDNKYENIYGNFYDGAVSFTAINNEGAQLTRGQVVYVDGVSGNTPTIALASADDPSKMPAMGLVADGTSNPGTEVRIVTFGSLRGMDTDGFSEGDTLYIQTGSSGVSGSLTNTPPTGSGALIQNIGRVLRVDASAGQVKVGGAGRTNATPNLDEGYLFVGNNQDQAVQDNTIYVDSANSKVGINTETLSHELTVVGTVSGSSNFSIGGAAIFGVGVASSGIAGNDSVPVFGIPSSGNGQFQNNLYMKDDKKIYFGDAGESFIEYNENGDDFMTISGSANGIVLSGSTIQIDGTLEGASPLKIGGEIQFVSNGSQNAFKFGPNQEASIYYQDSETSALVISGSVVNGIIMSGSGLYVDNHVGIGVGEGNATHGLTLPDNSDASGQVKANAFLSYSSIRFKEEVEPLENPIETLKKLNGVSYRWKDTGKLDYGFIAEEVGKVLPEIVEWSQDPEYANSMDYIRIISFLVEGAKAQDKKISDLENKLNLLVEKLDKIDV